MLIQKIYLSYLFFSLHELITAFICDVNTEILVNILLGVIILITVTVFCLLNFTLSVIVTCCENSFYNNSVLNDSVGFPFADIFYRDNVTFFSIKPWKMFSWLLWIN